MRPGDRDLRNIFRAATLLRQEGRRRNREPVEGAGDAERRLDLADMAGLVRVGPAAPDPRASVLPIRHRHDRGPPRPDRRRRPADTDHERAAPHRRPVRPARPHAQAVEPGLGVEARLGGQDQDPLVQPRPSHRAAGAILEAGGGPGGYHEGFQRAPARGGPPVHRAPGEGREGAGREAAAIRVHVPAQHDRPALHHVPEGLRRRGGFGQRPGHARASRRPWPSATRPPTRVRNRTRPSSIQPRAVSASPGRTGAAKRPEIRPRSAVGNGA